MSNNKPYKIRINVQAVKAETIIKEYPFTFAGGPYTEEQSLAMAKLLSGQLEYLYNWGGLKNYLDNAERNK